MSLNHLPTEEQLPQKSQAGSLLVAAHVTHPEKEELEQQAQPFVKPMTVASHEEAAATGPVVTHMSSSLAHVDRKSSKLSRVWSIFLKRPLLMGSSLGLLLVAGGVGYWQLGGSYWRTHALPRTYIATVDVGNMTKEQARRALEAENKKYTVSIKTKDGKTVTPTQTEVGLGFNTTKSIDDAMAAGKKKWWLEVPQIWKKQTITNVSSINSEKLTAYIATLGGASIKEPQNANLLVENGEVKIVPEVIGKKNGLKDGEKTITIAAERLQRITLNIEEVDAVPAVTTKSLESLKKDVEKIVGADVVLLIDGQRHVPSAATISGWTNIPKPGQNEARTITIDKGAVGKYIDDIASKYVTLPQNEIYTTDASGARKVIVAGKRGTDIIGKDTVAAKITEAVQQGKNVEEELAVQRAEYKSIAVKDAPKLIEVDLTAHQLTAYENGVAVQRYIVTVGSIVDPTLTGEFAIYRKIVNERMRACGNGGDCYDVYPVPWTNYYSGPYAIHAAPWRKTFGENASHGCVNLPTDQAKWVFDWAPVGTPVIVHS